MSPISDHSFPRNLQSYSLSPAQRHSCLNRWSRTSLDLVGSQSVAWLVPSDGKLWRTFFCQRCPWEWRRAQRRRLGPSTDFYGLISTRVSFLNLWYTMLLLLSSKSSEGLKSRGSLLRCYIVIRIPGFILIKYQKQKRQIHNQRHFFFPFHSTLLLCM